MSRFRRFLQLINPLRALGDLGHELARVMDEPETFLALARNGRRMVRERFEASRCFEAFAGLVEQELASRR